jgi:2-dehydropantoate 2-reductase
MNTLLIGAGVTGCYTAARLYGLGIDVTLFARGDKAERLRRDGLLLHDGVTGERRTVRLPLATAPVPDEYDLVMICVQDIQRASVETLLHTLPGRPILWYLGNTTKGYDRQAELFGRDRVLGGFPGVGGTWDGDELLYGDRADPDDPPFDQLIIGEPFPEGAPAREKVRERFIAAGMDVDLELPIVAWHWSHVALVVPLAGAAYADGRDLERLAHDEPLLEKAVRAMHQAFAVVRRAGYPLLPRRLLFMRWTPAKMGARRFARVMQSSFGRVAFGHANRARAEMRSLADDLLALGGEHVGTDLRELLAAI